MASERGSGLIFGQWEVRRSARAVNLCARRPADGTERITKRDGEAVHLVPEGTPNTTVVAVKRVNELDSSSLSTDQLATKKALMEVDMDEVWEQHKPKGRAKP